MWYYIEAIKANKEVKFAGDWHYIRGSRSDGRRYTILQFDSVRFSSVRCCFFRYSRTADFFLKKLRSRKDLKHLQSMRAMPVSDDFVAKYLPKSHFALVNSISVHLIKDAKFE